MLVLWTSTSINSRWVVEEADEALKRSCLLPVLLENVEPPLGFRAIQAADLTGWKPGKASTEMQRLLDDIRQFVESPTNIYEQQSKVAASSVNKTKKAPAENVSWFQGKKYTLGAILVVAVLLAGLLRLPYLKPSTVSRTVPQMPEKNNSQILTQPTPQPLAKKNPFVAVPILHLATDVEQLGQEAAKSLNSAGISSFTIRDIRSKESDYLVVIGSYKDASDAVRHLRRFRNLLTENIGLYYAINSYYAVAKGIYHNRDRAKQECDRVKTTVHDAYIYPTSRTPLQIDTD